jgi:UDP-N-acetylmuramate: L-alanyl-gamma-D-glutamyl-meso-diaminopimelate ligase
MKVHFIAIGGSVMHNLAIALKLKGYMVSGSDDEIFEPAKSNLDKYGLLPPEIGWNESRITSDLDGVILGMHAKPGNPELKKATALNLKIYSFPEFLYEHSKNKARVVIGGSHGKTTITAMVMHILKKNQYDFDYMVGASLPGFDISVRLSDSAKIMILEGDEYPDSAIGNIPKFHIYRPDIALLSGIAWDHINVFPTFESYINSFKQFIELIPPGGILVFNSEDEEVARLVREGPVAIRKIPYQTPVYEIKNGVTYLVTKRVNSCFNFSDDTIW